MSGVDTLYTVMTNRAPAVPRKKTEEKALDNGQIKIRVQELLLNQEESNTKYIFLPKAKI